jgi:hypothetical protein
VDVGIIIAKVHEDGNFVKAKIIKYSHRALSLRKYQALPNLKCIISYMNDQGPQIKTFTSDFLG